MPDVLQGGLAEEKPDSKYRSDQLRKGIKVEKEHTPAKPVAKEIAKDHLEEIPDYYDRLAEMEAEAKKTAGKIMPFDVRQLLGKIAQQTTPPTPPLPGAIDVPSDPRTAPTLVTRNPK